MKELLTVLFILGVLVVVLIGLWLDSISTKRADLKYMESLSKWFKPNYVLRVYKCKSKIFDEWELLYSLKILRYKDGYAWCERYDKDDEIESTGEEVNLMTLLSCMDKSVLLNNTKIIEHEWRSSWD